MKPLIKFVVCVLTFFAIPLYVVQFDKHMPHDLEGRPRTIVSIVGLVVFVSVLIFLWNKTEAGRVLI